MLSLSTILPDNLSNTTLGAIGDKSFAFEQEASVVQEEP